MENKDLVIEENLIKKVKEDIREVYLMNNLPWVIGYSGGKDSTCTTQVIIETIQDMKKEGYQLNKPIYIISADTLVENPMIVNTIHDAINNINNLASKENLPLSAHIIRPDYNNSFWANLIGRGYPCPNQTFRWCTDRMKINPANKFITSIVDKYGEAVMILGVRDGESNSRDRVLEKHTIEGRKLMRHTTMANAYVFAPIRSFSIDDVWSYLLSNESPWGQDNSHLYKLYLESSEDDYEMIFDEEQKRKQIGGNSRFGCWICTVVSKDKSLTAFIDKGEEWLIPLRDFRDWLYSIRDDESRRMRRRMDGSIYFSKINKVSETKLSIAAKGNRKKIIITLENGKWVDNEGVEWIVFEGVDAEMKAKTYIANNNVDLSDGSNPHIIIKRIDDEYAQLGPGPFTSKAREEMLRKLLELQNVIGDRYKLYKDEELLEIRKLWFKQGIWEDIVSKIYYEVNNRELNLISDDIILFNEKDLNILKELCEEEKLNVSIMQDIFNVEKKYMGYNNRQEVNKTLRKLLSQEFIHIENQGDNNEN